MVFQEDRSLKHWDPYAISQQSSNSPLICNSHSNLINLTMLYITHTQLVTFKSRTNVQLFMLEAMDNISEDLS